MADNYLENKMDDYRRGVTAKSPRRSCSGATAASAPISLTPHNIALFISAPGLLRALLTVFQGVSGQKVAFAGTDTREGSRLAQSTGSLFVPVRQLDTEGVRLIREEVARRWGAVDVIMTDCPDCILNASVSGADTIVPAPKTVVFNFCGHASACGAATAPGGHGVVINISSATDSLIPVARVALLLLSPQAEPITAIAMQL